MNISQVKQKQLEERMQSFAFDVIELSKQFPNNTENKIMVTQLIRSATSIGANYAEACNAISKLDFRNKIYICKKEAAETRYWLQLISKVNDFSDINRLLDECQQFIFILQKIVSTLQNAK